MAPKIQKTMRICLSLLGTGLLALYLWPLFSTLKQLSLIYQENPFHKGAADHLIEDVKQKKLMVDGFGRVTLPATMKYRGQTAYVTVHPAGHFDLLLPSYLEHESNSLGGYVFSQNPLPLGGMVKVLGPVRGGSPGPRSRLLTLTVDEHICEFWYHVHGIWG